jgi:RNA polymerase sigma factor (sigma-70 family)
MFLHNCPRALTSESTDRALMERTLEGDSVAFEEIIQKYHTPLIHYIGRQLGDYDLAYDVLQHVFLQLHLFLPKLYTNMLLQTKEHQLKSWLFQVAQNRCIQEQRRKRPILFSEMEKGDDDEGSLLKNIADNEPTPEEELEYQELYSILQEAIQRLPPKVRTIVNLRYREQRSFMEISQILGIPENTAKTHFHRARPLLRAALSEERNIANSK